MLLIKAIVVSIVLLVGVITKQIIFDYQIDLVRPYNEIMNSTYSEELIGEIDLPLTGKDPILIANKLLHELNLLLNSLPETWHNETADSYPLIVQSKKVSGWYDKYKLPVVRAKWIVKNCRSNELFNFLVSPEGFGVIDPLVDPNQHEAGSVIEFKDLHRKGVSRNMTFNMKYNQVKMLLLFTIDLLVYNVVDFDKKQFISKSVASDLDPGRAARNASFSKKLSFYQRAYNTFGFRVTDLKCKDKSKQPSEYKCNPSCQVESFNYMANFFPFPYMLAHFTYFVNARRAFPELVKRLDKALQRNNNATTKAVPISIMKDVEKKEKVSSLEIEDSCRIDPEGNQIFDISCIL